MLDAIGQIRLELEQESRARNRRSLVLFFLLAAVAISMPLLSGVNAALHPQSALAFAIAAGFVLLGVSASSSQQLRIGPNSAAAIAAVAFLSPLIGATSIGSHPTGLSC